MVIDISDGKLYIDKKQIILPNYEVYNQLGSGANAEVYLVMNTLLMRLEAMKVWKPRKGLSTVDPERFRNEVVKNSKFMHHNIAAFYHANIYNNAYIAFMEYCKGTTLKESLNEGRTYLERLSLLYQIASTMSTVYLSGYYHGDLHSENILVENGIIKLLDFGTSIFARNVEHSHKRDAIMLYQLSIDILPELKDFTFYYGKMTDKSSIDICNCILGLIHLLCFEANDFGDCPFDFYIMILAIIVLNCSAFDPNDVIAYLDDDRFIKVLDTIVRKKDSFQDSYNESIKMLDYTIEQLIKRYNSIIVSRDSFKMI